MIKKIPLKAFEMVPFCDDCGTELSLRQALWPRHLYICLDCKKEYAIDSEKTGVKFERAKWKTVQVDRTPGKKYRSAGPLRFIPDDSISLNPYNHSNDKNSE